MAAKRIPIPVPRVVYDFDISRNAPHSKVANGQGRQCSLILSPGGDSVVLCLQGQSREELYPVELESLTDVASVYCIGDAGSSGLGVFTTTGIERGEVIMRERPLMVYPEFVPFHRDLQPEDAYPELDEALSLLPAHLRAAFLQLANTHPEEPSRVKGIIDTNALHIGTLVGTPEQYAGVCGNVSRINHRSAHPHESMLAELTLWYTAALQMLHIASIRMHSALKSARSSRSPLALRSSSRTSIQRSLEPSASRRCQATASPAPAHTALLPAPRFDRVKPVVDSSLERTQTKPLGTPPSSDGHAIPIYPTTTSIAWTRCTWTCSRRSSCTTSPFGRASWHGCARHALPWRTLRVCADGRVSRKLWIALTRDRRGDGLR